MDNHFKSTFNMRKILLFFIASVCLFSYADPDEIVLNNPNHQHDHSGQPLFPADQPDVYYDDVTQQIIIDGTGEASYYDVEITSLSTFYVVLSTQVNGNYDTIDVSSLPDDNYEIVITSSLNNEYLGYFTKE